MVFYCAPGASHFDRLPGPGDLATKDAGTVRLSGDVAASWAVPLGLFALRGGEIRGAGR